MTRRLFLTADSIGGVWAYAGELARGLAECDYEITIAVLGPSPSDVQRKFIDGIGAVKLVETGLPLDWMARDPATVIETGRAIARLSELNRPDIVQLNQPALAADVAFSVPVVAVMHSCVGTWWQAVHGDKSEPDDFTWQTGLIKRGLAAVDAVVAPSCAFAAAVQTRYGLLAAPEAVHNGRTSFGQPSNALADVGFTAGRLWDEGKNIATLERAAARLGIPFKAAGPTVGPGGQRVVLRHLHSLGAIEEGAIARHLLSRPVFASAARYEPFGLAVLEAALAGCPLVLADIPTFRELWADAAMFVDPDNAAGFAAAITAMIGSIPLRLEHGDRARRRAADFTPRRMAAAMDGIYSRLLGRSGHRVAA